jgi:anti-anti-sigma factor
MSNYPQQPAMDIQVESLGNRRIVHINDKITVEHCPVLENRLDSILKEEVQEVVLDFKNVLFMDSSGVELIVRFVKRLRDQNAEFEVINPNRRVRNLFHLFRLEKFMKMGKE